MNVEEVISVLSRFELLRPSKIRGNWYSVYCPFHSGGEERRPSCGILLTDEYRNGQKYQAGMFHCFACGTTKSMVDAVTYLLQSKNISSDGLTWLQANVPGFSYDDISFDPLLSKSIVDTLTDKYAVSYLNSLSKPINYVSESELSNYRYTVPYMYERRLTDEAIALYDVGYDANWIPPGRKRPVPCITIPVRDSSHRTLFLCRRSISGKLYNYPSDVEKPLFGLDVVPNDCKSIIVCESCINAITAHIYGYQAVALLGTGSAYQIQKLKELGVNDIVLCMDGDEAGIKATKRLKKALAKSAIVWTISMPPGKDLNDCTKSEFDKLYSERE